MSFSPTHSCSHAESCSGCCCITDRTYGTPRERSNVFSRNMRTERRHPARPDAEVRMGSTLDLSHSIRSASIPSSATAPSCGSTHVDITCAYATSRHLTLAIWRSLSQIVAASSTSTARSIVCTTAAPASLSIIDAALIAGAASLSSTARYVMATGVSR
jgi:hypothetical protein